MIKLSQLLKISLLAIEQTEVFTRRDPDLARTLEDILMTINTPQDRIIYDVGRYKGENEEVIR